MCERVCVCEYLSALAYVIVVSGLIQTQAKHTCGTFLLADIRIGLVKVYVPGVSPSQAT